MSASSHSHSSDQFVPLLLASSFPFLAFVFVLYHNSVLRERNVLRENYSIVRIDERLTPWTRRLVASEQKLPTSAERLPSASLVVVAVSFDATSRTFLTNKLLHFITWAADMSTANSVPCGRDLAPATLQGQQRKLTSSVHLHLQPSPASRHFGARPLHHPLSKINRPFGHHPQLATLSNSQHSSTRNTSPNSQLFPLPSSLFPLPFLRGGSWRGGSRCSCSRPTRQRHHCAPRSADASNRCSNRRRDPRHFR